MLDAAPAPATGALLDTTALDAMAAAAWQLEVPSREELRWIDRPEAAELVDGLLSRLSRRLGAVEMAIGERLLELEHTGGEVRLGFSCIGDLAREKLGISATVAVARAKLAGQLRSRPLLRASVCSGEVSLSAAETIVEVALGDEEGTWVEAAKVKTVRALAALVAKRRGRSAPDPDEEDRSYRLRILVGPEIGPVVEAGLEYAGVVLGPTSSRADRFAASTTRPTRSRPPPGRRCPTAPARPGGRAAHRPRQRGGGERLGRGRDRCPGLRSGRGCRGRSLGDRCPPLVRPPGAPPRRPPARAGGPLRDPRAADERLRLVVCGLWRTAGFASLSHYTKERLGMSASALKQRVALERRMYELPGLREAVRDGRLSYEQARIVSWLLRQTQHDRVLRQAQHDRVLRQAQHDRVLRQAQHDRVAELCAIWIEKARGMTCIALRRLVEDEELGQMSRTGELKLDVPARVDSLLADAFTAARLHHRTWLPPELCLFVIAAHFIETYGPEVERRLAQASKVVKRDRGRCQVPGCSRHADQVHHIRFRSQGGSDHSDNLVSLCAIHHRSIHLGYVMVTGEAPDALTWILGEREAAARA